MSIVRIGLAETKNFAEGYEAIFGKKKNDEPKEDAKEDAKAEKDKDEKKEKKKAGKKKS